MGKYKKKVYKNKYKWRLENMKKTLKGLFSKSKKFTTVVMDGSNEETVRIIRESMNIVTEERYGEATCRSFSNGHPTIKVIDVYTTKKVYDKIQRMIEDAYPDLCVFDVPM